MSDRHRLFEPGSILALEPGAAARLEALGWCVTREDLAAAFPTAAAGPAQQRVKASAPANVGVVFISGVILENFDFFGFATSAAAARQQVNELAASASIDSMLLVISSPGGTVAGIEEAAAAVRAARDRKPVFAAIAGIGASAAYWIAAGADHITVQPSGQVGSLGVFALHADRSVALEREGVKVTLLTSDPAKVAGNPYEPLSDDARRQLQASVDFYARQFDSSVALGRGVSEAEVRARYGRGLLFQAPEALSRGLVDGIATVEAQAARAVEAARTRTSARVSQELGEAAALRRHLVAGCSLLEARRRVVAARGEVTTVAERAPRSQALGEATRERTEAEALRTLLAAGYSLLEAKQRITAARESRV